MERTGKVFNIEKFHIHDGEGIRTAVSLKGCHLRCPWCSNPESQKTGNEIVVFDNLCTACLRCENLCPQKAIYHIENRIRTNTTLCNFCGKCVEMCPTSARQIYGEDMTVAEVIREVMKDEIYYARSGGGVTVTGGEPLLQAEFVQELVAACRSEYLSVAVETCGIVSWDKMWMGLENADEILLDIKTTDPQKTVVIMPNGSDDYIGILRNNIRKLRQKDKNVIFRCPIIPGFNDTKSHVMSVVIWAKEFDVQRIDLLPFHQFGRHKHRALGLGYVMEDKKQLQNEDMENLKSLIERADLTCIVGG